ncbi:UNKNOWN [Stylonychia lemnae]|uniref:Uncharacterized protein n=1 Tax=Stylonychia lemnae TaxID=5949 RepID=A0A078A2A7_STYLE|nr:UNKNOWN [Stylonychia lemnae]|eukprot:CDW76336.1 UNKNOWN [Stylonychia lemnae]
MVSRQQIKVFDKNFNDKTNQAYDQDETDMFQFQDDKSSFTNSPDNKKHSKQMSFVRFNYDDDTYELIDSKQASKIQDKAKQQRYLDKVNGFIQSQKTQKRVNAQDFLEKLNKNKKLALVKQMLRNE